MCPDSALDSAGIEIENREILAGNKKPETKVIISSSQLQWIATLLSFWRCKY